jgi:hypothetical protein
MKKFLVLFVCVAALSAGGAFALDLPDAIKIPGLTVTGDVRTGLRVEGGTHLDADDETVFADPVAYAYSDDLDDGTPFRAQLQLVWERDKLGVKTRFRYRPDGNANLNGTLASLNNTVNKAFVYANLFDNKAKVSVGKSTDEAWGIPYSSFANNTGLDGSDGVKLEVKPIEGLNVGAFYGTGNLFAKAYKKGSDSAFTDKDDLDDKNYGFRRLVIGAKYSSDILTVTAAWGANVWELDNNDFLGSTPNDDGVYFYKDPTVAFRGTSNLLLGASFTPSAIPLTINFAGEINGIGSKTPAKAYKDLNDADLPDAQAQTLYNEGKFNPYWVFVPKLNGEFGVNDALTVGLTINDFYFADGYYTAESKADDPKDVGLGLLFPITFNPYVTYALNDDITLGADLNFKINTNGSDVFGFGIKPSAEFSLGSGAKFVVYDEITFYGKSKGVGDDLETEWAAEHSGAAGSAGGLANTSTNTLQFDFVWTF